MNADFTGVFKVLFKIEDISEMLQLNKDRAVMMAAMAYQGDVQKIAPVDTGQYRSSIRVDLLPGIRPSAGIGSPMPQTRRLEYGFVGEDSLGRVYNQAPRPHWRPMWDLNLTTYERILNLALAGKI